MEDVAEEMMVEVVEKCYGGCGGRGGGGDDRKGDVVSAAGKRHR